jgi:hypothetical protein
MRQSFLILLVQVLLSQFSLAQKPDAISGETIKKDNLELFLTNDSIRARYNNDAYDNIPVLQLNGKLPLVAGEILNPGIASTENLLLRSLVVKEFVPGGENQDAFFLGAFQYYGYSLADLLKDYVVDKINAEEFKQSTDLFIVVENDAGEKAVFSWGELYYSARPNDIILATAVQPIWPKRDKDRWELPQGVKVVAANDYLAVRNIERPTKITIRSFPRSFPGYKGLRPLYSPEIEVSGPGINFIIKNQESIHQNLLSHKTVFFGLSLGFKGGRSFKGASLSDVLSEAHSFSVDDIKTGVIAFGAKDAYRVVYSISELINRTDMQETLLIDAGDDEDGRFIIRPGSDFFADRHLKGAKRAYILILD